MIVEPNTDAIITPLVTFTAVKDAIANPVAIVSTKNIDETVTKVSISTSNETVTIVSTKKINGTITISFRAANNGAVAVPGAVAEIAVTNVAATATDG